MTAEGREQDERQWPSWLNQMPVDEVMRLAAGGSVLAADYVAYCEAVGRAAHATAREQTP